MLKPFYSDNLIEAGLDEAGRGCLAGPVVAAAVILPRDFSNALLNDSKQVKKTDRNTLEKEVCKTARAWAVAEVWNDEIDEINILNASIRAMHRALDQLSLSPEMLLIDGNRFKPYHELPFECIVKGDGIYSSIAAASILAKVHRDRLMEKLAEECPGYGWETNVGYPTQLHRQAIKDSGPTIYHRKSFKLLKGQKELFPSRY